MSIINVNSSPSTTYADSLNRRIALILVGAIWTIAGCTLIMTGSFGLAPGIAQANAIFWIAPMLAVLVGIAKGYFVLRRAALRSLENLTTIQDSPADAVFGFLKLLGLRGCIIIIVMIGLGSWLGSYLETFNPIYRSWLRITIGTALFVGAGSYWSALRK